MKTIDKLTDIQIELFHISDVQYNITKHVLQPIFTRLVDKIEFIKQYGNKYSKLKMGDPIRKFYNYNKGDVIKVTRKSLYNDTDITISYRIVTS